MKLTTLILVVAGLGCNILAAPTIDPALIKNLKEKGTQTILISFKASNTAGIRNSLVFPEAATRQQRASVIYNVLKSHADETQGNVLEMLSKHQSSRPFTVRQFWITNQVAVKKADLELVQKLLKIDDISRIEEDRIVPMHTPVEEIFPLKGSVPQEGDQWGVEIINASAVWADGIRGAGVVIANIDTGVRGTHEAVRDGYRSQNGWYDPMTGFQVPTDANGHGTHTMGTILGRTYGIGVAPEAKWIACKACDGGCPRVDLIDCGQWVVCPTELDGSSNPRCDLGPSAVSNSWGGGIEDDWYDDVIATWIKAGMVPLFSAGNSGPLCSTANSPADSDLAIAVGSTTSSNWVSTFSSVGPTYTTRRMKPDIAAPGSTIYSANHLADNDYGIKSGTSMACPHAAGLTALLFSARPNLTVAQIKQLLIAGAQPTVTTGRNCGGISEETYPNHHVGAGRISAKASVDALRKLP
ncbi:unnamed protein product [Allacma fusca]|uniref:Peptidase S8/S53 domain-containing protein n=1 Tax=Allacma fusca TaxID=39272 RepID=A0A8J2LCC0_9HEXA|nr:unnamed protein product [Allacma fusca]